MTSSFDPRHVRRAFSRAAASYDAAAALQREVEKRLLESLDYLKTASRRSCWTWAAAPAMLVPR